MTIANQTLSSKRLQQYAKQIAQLRDKQRSMALKILPIYDKKYIDEVVKVKIDEFSSKM